MGFFFFAILLLLSQNAHSSWFFSGKQEPDPNNNNNMASGSVKSEFSMESLQDNQKGIQLLNKAKTKIQTTNSCWQVAYQNIFKGCDKTLADDELKSRLSWHLSDCFQRHAGQPPFPYCDSKSKMDKCLKNLDREARGVYLEYYMETNSICHQLQIVAFRGQFERLVNDLRTVAEHAEETLEKIEEQGNLILEGSKKVHESLSSIDLTTQQVAETSKIVEHRVVSVQKLSEIAHEQSKGIAASQVELRDGQAKMNENLAQGLELIQDSHERLGSEIVKLRNETANVEKEIGKVGEAMVAKMSVLQSKADDIGEIAGTSLDKQRQLLDGQSVALEGIQFLTKYQSQALEESRETLEKLAKFGHKQQEELLEKQKQLHESHDHLVASSKLIIEAQEAFESKQATMFHAINKLFDLHSAMLFESRVIITVIVYSIAIFIIYMLTSIKQAYHVRHRFYLGMCAAFLIEVIIMWYAMTDAEQQGRIIQRIRSLFCLLAFTQYVCAIFTYRDYEMLNHKLLMTLMEKVNGIHGNNKELLTWEEEEDSEVNWSSWVEDELPEEVDFLEDPDFLLPKNVEDDDDSSDTSSSIKRYNLRRRR